MTESVLPTPVLLDTFSSADGTDPTTRNLDVYPLGAGASRWRWEGEEIYEAWEAGYPPYVPAGEQYYYMLQGRIQSGALTPTQPLTLTEGMFAPSTTMPAGVSLKLRTDSTSELLSGSGVFVYINGFEGGDRIGDAAGINLILAELHDTNYDAGIDISFQINGQISASAYDVDWSGGGSGVVAGAKRAGVYVTSDEITLIANGAVVSTESPGIAFTGPWTGFHVVSQNPVISDYISEYQNIRLNSVAVYANLTLAQAISLTEAGP